MVGIFINWMKGCVFFLELLSLAKKTHKKLNSNKTATHIILFISILISDRFRLSRVLFKNETTGIKFTICVEVLVSITFFG